MLIRRDFSLFAYFECLPLDISLQPSRMVLMSGPNLLILDYTWSIALNIILFCSLRLLDACQDGDASDASSCSFRAFRAVMPLMSS
jgi:hypothetical protein